MALVFYQSFLEELGRRHDLSSTLLSVLCVQRVALGSQDIMTSARLRLVEYGPRSAVVMLRKGVYAIRRSCLHGEVGNPGHHERDRAPEMECSLPGSNLGNLDDATPTLTLAVDERSLIRASGGLSPLVRSASALPRTSTLPTTVPSDDLSSDFPSECGDWGT